MSFFGEQFIQGNTFETNINAYGQSINNLASIQLNPSGTVTSDGTQLLFNNAPIGGGGGGSGTVTSVTAGNQVVITGNANVNPTVGVSATPTFTNVTVGGKSVLNQITSNDNSVTVTTNGNSVDLSVAASGGGTVTSVNPSENISITGDANTNPTVNLNTGLEEITYTNYSIPGSGFAQGLIETGGTVAGGLNIGSNTAFRFINLPNAPNPVITTAIIDPTNNTFNLYNGTDQTQITTLGTDTSGNLILNTAQNASLNFNGQVVPLIYNAGNGIDISPGVIPASMATISATIPLADVLSNGNDANGSNIQNVNQLSFTGGASPLPPSFNMYNDTANGLRMDGCRYITLNPDNTTEYYVATNIVGGSGITVTQGTTPETYGTYTINASGGGGGGVQSVTAGSANIVIGGTATDPTVDTSQTPQFTTVSLYNQNASNPVGTLTYTSGGGLAVNGNIIGGGGGLPFTIGNTSGAVTPVNIITAYNPTQPSLIATFDWSDNPGRGFVFNSNLNIENGGLGVTDILFQQDTSVLTDCLELTVLNSDATTLVLDSKNLSFNANLGVTGVLKQNYVGGTALGETVFSASKFPGFTADSEFQQKVLISGPYSHLDIALLYSSLNGNLSQTPTINFLVAGTINLMQVTTGVITGTLLQFAILLTSEIVTFQVDSLSPTPTTIQVMRGESPRFVYDAGTSSWSYLGN